MPTKIPEVTVITANYNCERFIAETIESVQKQSFTNWEMIIVDDKSTDKSISIIKKYSRADSRIKLIKLKTNSGPAVARNKAIQNSRGRFIAFLDSDDLWMPNKLEVQVATMKEEKLALSYTEYQKIDEEGKITSKTIKRPINVNYEKMLSSNYIPCLTAIYDSDILGKVYMPNILKRQDYGLWLKILKEIEHAQAINTPLAYYRVRKNDSVSSNKIKSAVYHWKILRELEKIPMHSAIWYFCNYAVLGYLKFRK